MEPFGSFLTNLFTRRGDLDISIEINNGLLVPSSGKLRKLIVLRDLMKTMRERGRFVFLVNSVVFYNLVFLYNFYNRKYSYILGYQ